MAEPPEIDPLRLCVEQAKTVISRIDKADLELDTPCESWTVRDVLNAVVVKANLFAEAVKEARPAKPIPWPNLLADDPAGDVSNALDTLVRAYEQPMESPVVLPLGTVPWPVARQVATLDVTLHTWDLAVATGQSIVIPSDLVNDCLAAAAMITDELREKGEFKAALHDRADSTPLEELLATAGRSPDWTRQDGPHPG